MSRRAFGNKTTVAGMATRTKFGKTRNFVTNMTVENLLNSLSMKALPDQLQELYKDVQRVTTATRVDSFEDYCALHLLDEKDVAGYVPAITISLDRFYNLEEHDDGLDILEFTPTSAFAVDGLGRLNTWMRILGIYPTYIRGKTKENKNRLERRLKIKQMLASLEVSVVFVISAEGEEIEARDVGQVFADVNFKQEKVKPIHAMRLDTSDPIIQWSRELAKLPSIVSAGGMSEDATRITPNSKSIVTLNTLVRFAQGCVGGITMQAKSTGAKQLSDGTEVNNDFLKNYKTKVSLFLSTWLNGLSNRLSEDKTGYQVNSSLIQALGLVFYSVHNAYSEFGTERQEHELIKAATKLAEMDYSRFANHWENCEVMELRDRGYANSSAGGRTFREGLAKYFCGCVGLTMKS